MIRLLLRPPPGLRGLGPGLRTPPGPWRPPPGPWRPPPGHSRPCSGPPPRLPAAEVRRLFLDFFREKHGHLLVPSAPVRPRGDPSLLFVNAGMNQFKPVFLGTADPRGPLASYRRVANSQKCVRAGGKHNDLQDVGRSLSHHTFFEMLGSWSFGDYFKEDACRMAWTLLTETYGVPADRLYLTYFGGDAALGLPPDLETRDIWLDLGVPAPRVRPFGLGENFWEMGDQGPCGPCTEIHFDHIGNRDAGDLVNRGNPEVVELWNLVFIQYNREADRTLRRLPRFSVDTGMGLERLVGVLQGTRSNYDTDLFSPLMHAIHQRSGVAPYGGRTGPADPDQVDPDQVDLVQVDLAYRVVADHIRTLTVCIADGVHPGMSGAELVLRRILRRAVRFWVQVLKAPEGTLASLVPTVIQTLGEAYPELEREADRVVEVVSQNEAQFLASLKQGSRLVHRTLSKRDPKDLFPASVAWSLHRDLGFPLDLVDLMLEEKGVRVDRQELDRLISESQKGSGASPGGASGPGGAPGPGGGSGPGGASGPGGLQLDVLSLAELQRLGVPLTDDSLKYQYRLEAGHYVFPACRATVVALYDGRALVDAVSEGQRCGVLLDQTCFYSEQGGQSHDRGYFTREDTVFPVEAVFQAGGYVVHHVTAAGTLRTGDQVQLHLDEAHRIACMVQHTATHLLNRALREVLGPGAHQRGSSVSAQRLRFDVSSKGSLSEAQLQEVERNVGELISANRVVHSAEVPLQSAMTVRGLRTVDEVYPDPVRLVSVGVPVLELLASQRDGGASVELCCGTHLLRTGSIQDLVIVSERQLVKGISRILAVTGQEALQAREAGQALAQDLDSLSARLSLTLDQDPNPNQDPDQNQDQNQDPDRSRLDAVQRLAKEASVLLDAVDNTPLPHWQRRQLQGRLRGLLRTSSASIRKQEERQAALGARLLLQRTSGFGDLLVASVETDSPSVLMKMVNRVSGACPGGHVMLLALQESGKLLVACQVPKEAPWLPASDWAAAVCRRVGGASGGSPLVAKGTGRCHDITEALRWAEAAARGGGQDGP